jgi:hypothetical protein
VQHALPGGLGTDLHQQFALLADEQRATIPGRPLRGEFRTQLVPDVAEGSQAAVQASADRRPVYERQRTSRRLKRSSAQGQEATLNLGSSSLLGPVRMDNLLTAHI